MSLSENRALVGGRPTSLQDGGGLAPEEELDYRAASAHVWGLVSGEGKGPVLCPVLPGRAGETPDPHSPAPEQLRSERAGSRGQLSDSLLESRPG